MLDSKAAVQTLTYGTNNWVSYDDETTLKMKLDYANTNYLGGTMVWAASTDDSKGSAATALAKASGVSIGPKGTQIGIVVSDNPGLCSWTTCAGSCPAGTSAAAFVLDGCPQPTKGPFNFRQFCCPSNDVPVCNIRMEDVQGNTCIAGSCPAGTQLLTTTQFLANLPYRICPGGGHINCKRFQSYFALVCAELTVIETSRVLYYQQVLDEDPWQVFVVQLRRVLPQWYGHADPNAFRRWRRLVLHHRPAQPLLPERW